MLTKWERILNDYRVWYPTLYANTVECRPIGRSVILLTMKDGSKLEYCAFDNTIRDVTKFYDSDYVKNLDENSWRDEFGNKLRSVMTHRGINQEKLSDLLGVSRQMMTRYVRGKSTPSAYILTKLSDALDCDIRELSKFGYEEKGD